MENCVQVRTRQTNIGNERYKKRRKVANDKYTKVIMQPTEEFYAFRLRSLTERGKIRESLNNLYHIIRVSERPVNNEIITTTVTQIVEWLSAQSKLKYGKQDHRTAFSCQSCHGLLVDPITVSCGHTYCKLCIQKGPTTCNACKYKFRQSDLHETCVNVLIASLVKKLWPDEIESYDLRKLGNTSLRQDPNVALKYYNEAISIAPTDHALFGNRSYANQMLKDFEKALVDANEAIRLRPDWAKGYYRKAVALMELEKWEDSLISLLICASLENPREIRHLVEKITMVLLACFRSHDIRDSELGCNSEQMENQDDMQNQTTLFQQNMPFIDDILEEFDNSVRIIVDSKPAYERALGEGIVNISELECTLCYHYLWHPVSTPCGHVFCKACLDRSLDHNPYCPLCKSSLEVYLAERRSSITEFIDSTMKNLFTKDYEDNKQKYEQELSELAKAGTDLQHEIPIFVACLAYPTVSCPLHIFEARYRLMIRRCMEAGTREFGMCVSYGRDDKGYSDYGTMLEIRQIDYTHDGRAILNTVGGRRFKCQSKAVRDGYHTAIVEFIKDNDVSDIDELQEEHQKVHELAKSWFKSLPVEQRCRIIGHYGSMPLVERNYWQKTEGPNWIWWVIIALPVSTIYQLDILKEVSLMDRLKLMSGLIKRAMNENDET